MGHRKTEVPLGQSGKSINNWIVTRRATDSLITRWSSRLFFLFRESLRIESPAPAQEESLLSSWHLSSGWTLSPNSGYFDFSSLNELCCEVYDTLGFPPPPFLLLLFFIWVCLFLLSGNVQRLECENREKRIKEIPESTFILSVDQENL